MDSLHDASHLFQPAMVPQPLRLNIIFRIFLSVSSLDGPIPLSPHPAIFPLKAANFLMDDPGLLPSPHPRFSSSFFSFSPGIHETTSHFPLYFFKDQWGGKESNDMKWKILDPYTCLNLISVIILLVGLGSAILIYRTAEDTPYGVWGHSHSQWPALPFSYLLGSFMLPTTCCPSRMESDAPGENNRDGIG